MKLKKRLAALLAAVMLIAAFGPATAFAGGSMEWYSNGWWYRYYLCGSIDLMYYDGSARNLTIPDKIGSVPVNGFYQYPADTTKPIIRGPNVETITFQLPVTELPPYFAEYCSNLVRVTLPDILVSIGSRAFSECTRLTAVELPASLQIIDEYAFFDCHALSAVDLPDSLQTIGNCAFYDCNALSSVKLPAALRSLGTGAFKACEQLGTVTIEEGVQRINDSAFSNCTALSSIDLPDSVVFLGQQAFSECTGLITAELPEGLQGIAASLFYGCSSLTTCEIPASVRLIHRYAFYGCEALKSVSLPAGLTTLEDYAFSESGLTSVYIPGGVSNIGAYAFYLCKALKNVTVGYGVRTIGESIISPEKKGYTFCNCNRDLTVTLPASVIGVCRNSFFSSNSSNSIKKYFNGEKRLLDRIAFESETDKNGFRYRVPLRFETEHGEAPAAVSPYVGETITLPTLTEKGYDFLGWWRSSDNYHFYDGAPYTVGAEPDMFSAAWMPHENLVTFVTEKGNTPTAQIVTSGNRAAAPAGQTAGDEYLVGWYTTPDFSGEPYDFSEPVLESITLYAKWTSAPLIDVNFTGAANGNAVAFCDRNDFDVIYASFTGSGSARVPADAVMTVTAGSGAKYSGSIVSEIPLNDDKVEVRTVNIVNGTERYTPDYGSRTTVNIAFTAAPQVVVNAVGDNGLNTDGLWTLTDGYDPPHNLTNGSPVTVSDDAGIADPRNDLTLTLAVPEGYGCDGTIFNGSEVIDVSEGKTTYYFTPLGVVTLNLHYYKKADYVTLTFNCGRDSRFFTQKYPKGANAPVSFTVPDCPYTFSTAAFNRWQSAAGDCVPGETVTIPQTDTVYTAVWDAAYTLSLRDPSTGETEKIMVLEKDGYTVTLPECPYYNSGYAFVGWNTKANGSGTDYQPGDVMTLTKSTSLYARWSEAYRVRLYANYEDSVISYYVQWIPQGNSAPLVKIFERDGYMLTGWSDVPDGSGTFYAPGAAITPERDTALYAQWHAHDYQFDSFVWAADNTTAQVKLVCADDETHVSYVDAEMTAFTHEASCEADAFTVYEAIYGGNSETRTVTAAGSALGHDYGTPEWNWTAEYTETGEGTAREVSAVMEQLCSRCGETCSWNAAVACEETVQPTADQPGEMTYTATVVIDGVTYTNVHTEEIPALGLPAHEAAQALIDAIGEVTYTPDCKAAIDMARALYDSLTAEEKSLVTNLAVLEAAEQAYAALTPDDPILVKAPGSSVVIDEGTGFLYGLPDGDTAALTDLLASGLVEITGGAGYLTYEYAADANVVGTGTKVCLYRSDGVLMNTYTIVVFGDVDGDGRHDGTDAYYVSLLTNALVPDSALTDAQLMAADCNHDGAINSADAALLEQCGLMLANVDQTVPSEEL